MTLANDPRQERVVFVLSGSGNDENDQQDGGNAAHPFNTFTAALDFIATLNPTLAEPVTLEGSGNPVDETITNLDNVQLFAPEVQILRTEGVALVLANEALHRVFTASTLGTIAVQCTDRDLVGLKTLDISCGGTATHALLIDGTTNNFFGTMDQIRVLNDGIGVEIDASGIVPPNIKFDKCQLMANNATGFVINCTSANVTTIEGGQITSITPSFAKSTGTTALDVTGCAVAITVRSIDASNVFIRNGSTVEYEVGTSNATITVESGGIINIIAEQLDGAIIVQSGGIAHIIAAEQPGDITVDAGGLLFIESPDHTGSLTENGTINGIISGVFKGTYAVATSSPGGPLGSVQYNDGGNFAGDNNLFWKNVAKRLGIGINSPDGTLHVHTGTAGSIGPTSAANDLTVENSSDGGISILTPDGSTSAINFGSPGRQVGAFFRWLFTNNLFTIGTGNSGAEVAISSGINQQAIRIKGTQEVIIGGSTLAGDAKFQVDSTTQGAAIPRMTTAQRDNIASPFEGLEIYNLTMGQPEFFDGTTWMAIGSTLPIAFAGMNANSVVTIIASADTYQALDATTLISNAITNQFTLTDAIAGIYRYDGDNPISVIIACIVNTTKAGTTENYRFAVSINGAIPVFATAPYAPVEIQNAKVASTLLGPAPMVKNNTIQIMVAGDGTDDDLTITDYLMEIR